MPCMPCQKKAEERLRKAQAKGKSTGSWSVTMPNGDREFFDNKLAAMAWNVDQGGGGMIRSVS